MKALNSSLSVQVSIGCQPISGQVFGAVSEGPRTRLVALAGRHGGQSTSSPSAASGRVCPAVLPPPLASPQSPLRSRLLICPVTPPNTSLPPTWVSVQRPSPGLAERSPSWPPALSLCTAVFVFGTTYARNENPRCHLPPAKGHCLVSTPEAPCALPDCPAVSASGGSAPFGPRVRGPHKLQGPVSASRPAVFGR